MGCSEAFRDKANSVKHPRNVTSHVGSLMNVSGENMTKSGEVLECPKTAKIEGYNTRFRTFSGSEFWTPQDHS